MTPAIISSIICSMEVITEDEVGHVKSARLAIPDEIAAGGGVRGATASRLVLPLASKHWLYKSHLSEKSAYLVESEMRPGGNEN